MDGGVSLDGELIRTEYPICLGLRDGLAIAGLFLNGS